MTKFSISILVLIAAAFFFLYRQNSQAPTLGVNGGKLVPLGAEPNCVSTQTEIAAKKVDPLPMKDSLEKTIDAIRAAINSYANGTVTIELESANYVYAQFKTPTMKWVDDVEFWVDETVKIVHFRSSSRAGYSDKGLNRQRYNKLAEIYKAS